MILIGYDDCIACAQHLAKGLGKHVRVLRGGWTKGDFVGLDAHCSGKTRLGLVHFFTAQTGRFVGTVGLHFALGVKARQAVDDLPTRIGATRVLEEQLTVQRRLFKGRELRADKVQVERRAHGVSAPMY